MPSLAKFVLTSDTADGNGGVLYESNCIRLNIPDSAEACGGAVTTTVDLHETLTIPSGFAAIFGPYEVFDIDGTTDFIASARSHLVQSTSALTVRILNFSAATSTTPTAGEIIGYLILLPTVELLHSSSGF